MPVDDVRHPVESSSDGAAEQRDETDVTPGKGADMGGSEAQQERADVPEEMGVVRGIGGDRVVERLRPGERPYAGAGVEERSHGNDCRDVPLACRTIHVGSPFATFMLQLP